MLCSLMLAILGFYSFTIQKRRVGWEFVLGGLRAITQSILLLSPSGLMIQSSLFMEHVKKPVEGGANLYLHFSVICKVSNGKNDFALKASKQKSSFQV